MDYFHFQSLGWLGLSGKESLVRQDRMDHHCRIDSGWWQNDCRLKKIFTLFSFLSIRRAIRDWFVHDWEIEEFVWILNRRETNGKQTTVNFNFHFLKVYSQKMTLDVMNVLMMSGSWSYGGVSSFFLDGKLIWKSIFPRGWKRVELLLLKQE